MTTLNGKKIDDILNYGVLQFSFEDMILALDLEDIDEKDLAEAKRLHRKGQLLGEVTIRSELYKAASKGNVGAAKELVASIKKGSAQKKTLPSR